MGYKNLEDDDSVSIVRDLLRRKSEISDLLKLGKTVLISISQPLSFYRATGEKEYSGTGRNRATTKKVILDDILNYLPIRMTTVKATGADIDFKGDELLREFWESMKDTLYFNAYTDNTVGKPFLFIKGTNKVVGSYLPFDKGNLILLPSLLELSDFKTKKDYKLMQASYVNTFRELTLSLKNDTGDIELPLWTNDFYCLFTHNNEVLLTTHWDSHFSLLCSDKETVSKIVMFAGLEGYYCDDKSEIYWSLQNNSQN